MEKKKPQNAVEQPVDTSPEKAAAPKPHEDEEHKGGNYMFALKVLVLLVAIILVIVILQASGVPVAIRDWFRAVTDSIDAPLNL